MGSLLPWCLHSSGKTGNVWIKSVDIWGKVWKTRTNIYKRLILSQKSNEHNKTAKSSTLKRSNNRKRSGKSLESFFLEKHSVLFDRPLTVTNKQKNTPNEISVLFDQQLLKYTCVPCKTHLKDYFVLSREKKNAERKIKISLIYYHICVESDVSYLNIHITVQCCLP